tara:strand:+ start:75 stop:419 length:345 start_codon:yes stop_codon:yes gene_type:complete
MYIFENLIIIFSIFFFVVLFLYLLKKKKSKSDEERIVKNLKIYYDKDFKEFIEIISKKLTKDEFDKMSSVLYNLRNGYDYGFEDSIKLAFYNEIQSIKRTRKKEKIVRIKFSKQ